MKILIWAASILLTSIIAVMIKSAGITLGGIPTMILYAPLFFITPKLCKKWDEHKARKEAQKKSQSRTCSNNTSANNPKTVSAKSDSNRTASSNATTILGTAYTHSPTSIQPAVATERISSQAIQTSPAKYNKIRCIKDLTPNCDGCFVEIFGNFKVTEFGYELDILLSSEPPVLPSNRDPDIHYNMRSPYSHVVVEVFPLPTSDSRKWKTECDQHRSMYLYGTAKMKEGLKHPIPSLFGVLQYVNKDHYRLLGAFRSATPPSATQIHNASVFVDKNRYLIPNKNDTQARQKISDTCQLDTKDYGLRPENPLFVEHIDDICYLLKNIRNKEGVSFHWYRTPDALICVNKPGIGIISVLEYVLKSSVNDQKVSLFICRHGASLSPKDPKFKVPYGLVLSEEKKFSEEELFDVCAEIVTKTLISKYSAREGDKEFEIFIPTSDGGLYLPCSVRDEVQKFLTKKMEWNPKIKSNSPNATGNAYKTEMIISIYRMHAQEIKWVIDPKLRIEIEHLHDTQYIQEKSIDCGMTIDQTISIMNMTIENVFQQNWNALLKENAFVAPQTNSHAEIQSSYIFCRKCGTKIPGDSLFCTKCGTEIIQC